MQNDVVGARNARRRSDERFCNAPAAVAVLVAAAVCPAYGQVKETALYTFTGGKDGLLPFSTLLADLTGPGRTPRALYGTTKGGGPPNGCVEHELGVGCGIVFRLRAPYEGQPAWTEQLLWDFAGGANGRMPESGLITPTGRISETTLYGTTSGSIIGGGNGTVFSLTGRALTTIWNFSGGKDGGFPLGELAADKSGALYGATELGGAGGCGTVYKLTPPGADQSAWSETTLWAFQGGRDGCFPNPVVVGYSGAVYGTTSGGDAGDYGTAFKLTPPTAGQTAWTEEILHTFSDGDDGAYPSNQLILGKHGELYGTTKGNVVSVFPPPLPVPDCSGHDCGTIFQLLPPAVGQTGWTVTTLLNLSEHSDGAYPFYYTSAALLIDGAGALYGTASWGGSFRSPIKFCREYGCGSVFKLSPPEAGQTAWTEATLWIFSGGNDGGNPWGGLIADGTGALYGAAEKGGAISCYLPEHGCGVIYKLTGTGFQPVP